MNDPPADLSALAAAIHATHQAGQEADREAERRRLECRLALGRLLLEARPHFRYGRWQRWLDEVVPGLCHRTAVDLLRLARAVARGMEPADAWRAVARHTAGQVRGG
jgi:hypothetical protein